MLSQRFRGLQILLRNASSSSFVSPIAFVRSRCFCARSFKSFYCHKLKRTFIHHE